MSALMFDWYLVFDRQFCTPGLEHHDTCEQESQYIRILEAGF